MITNESGNRVVICLGWVSFLISLGGQAPHALRARMGVHRTCGEPDEIGSTPMGVALNGSGRVHGRVPVAARVTCAHSATAPHRLAQFAHEARGSTRLPCEYAAVV